MAGTAQKLLTLEEVALVADGLVDSLTDDGAKRLGQFLRTDPRIEAELAELEELARMAGLRPGDSHEYLSLAQAGNEALTRLLDADGWRRAADVLDPDGFRGIPYPLLISLAREREGKSEDPGKILEVRQRLEEALAAEEAEDALVEQFVAGLLKLPPRQATHLLARAIRRYERQVKESVSP